MAIKKTFPALLDALLSGDSSAAEGYANDLATWISKGGFVPQALTDAKTKGSPEQRRDLIDDYFDAKAKRLGPREEGIMSSQPHILDLEFAYDEVNKEMAAIEECMKQDLSNQHVRGERRAYFSIHLKLASLLTNWRSNIPTSRKAEMLINGEPMFKVGDMHFAEVDDAITWAQKQCVTLGKSIGVLYGGDLYAVVRFARTDDSGAEIYGVEMCRGDDYELTPKAEMLINGETPKEGIVESGASTCSDCKRPVVTNDNAAEVSETDYNSHCWDEGGPHCRAYCRGRDDGMRKALEPLRPLK